MMQTAEKALAILALSFLLFAFFANARLTVEVSAPTEQETFVHTYINDGPRGNWTYVEKPFFPVLINQDQISVGQNWSLVYPLQAQHGYHAYCYGRWINNASVSKTDYDIYVYNPAGTLEGYRTASAGQIEHLGMSLDQPYFIPELTGNYTFTIVNDPRESSRADQATFMLIESMQTDTWRTNYQEGKGDNGRPRFNTSWAYEFVTDSRRIEIQVNIPSTLDIYEARLYLMATPSFANYTLLDGIPLSWELGLFGNKSGTVGGYNTDSQGNQGIAYASCSEYGQDLLLTFNGTSGKSLYHLVFIGENGQGNIDFMVKTVFDAGLVGLNNPDRIFPEQSATITYVSKSTNLFNATLRYTVDGWNTTNTTAMQILADNRTCACTIPTLNPGSIVNYTVEAMDVLHDTLRTNGSYTVGQAERTFVEKPMYPTNFSEQQIPIGREWSIVSPLEANRTYHAYCYGDWINAGSEPNTDYDLYVYDPHGAMVGYHTESAGLPEHLGSTVDEAFFVPQISGNYTFVVGNDPRESKGADAATFMIIENSPCNEWQQRYLEGTDNENEPERNTSWAYEFVTDSRFMEIYVNVPETLDMYESRLYLMSDPDAENLTVLNGVPLAWELGLYGNKSKNEPVIGGYNLESKEYRGIAYASCEFHGQDMSFNFTSASDGTTLYHLVFIGEEGQGTIEFLIKTEFNRSYLIPTTIPGRVYPDDNVTIACTSAISELKNATLTFSIDGWQTHNETAMQISNRTCTGAILGQNASTIVSYSVEARDVLENLLAINGSYTVKYASSLNITLAQEDVRFGDNATVTGKLTPEIQGMTVTVYFVSTNETVAVKCTTLDDGTFSTTFKPQTMGAWLVSASCNGTASVYESETAFLTLTIEESFMTKYSLYIFGGVGAIAIVGIVIFIRKSKG